MYLLYVIYNCIYIYFQFAQRKYTEQRYECAQRNDGHTDKQKRIREDISQRNRQRWYARWAGNTYLNTDNHHNTYTALNIRYIFLEKNIAY